MNLFIIFICFLLVIWLSIRWKIRKNLSRLSDEEIRDITPRKTKNWKEELWRRLVIGEMMRRHQRRKKIPD